MYTAAHVLKAKQDPALGVGAVRAGTGRAQHRPPPPLNGPLATWRAKTSSWASACNSTSQKRLVLSCNYATLISREIPLGPRVQLNLSYVSTNGAGMDQDPWREVAPLLWPACPPRGPTLQFTHVRSWVTPSHPSTFPAGVPPGI